VKVAMPARDPWAQILELSERLLKGNQLSMQCREVERIASELFEAKARLWLDRSMFHLPGLEQTRGFSTSPSSKCLRQAFKKGQVQESEDKKTLAVPLKNQDILLGALQIVRPDATPFSKRERDLLEKLAAQVALLLTISHRNAVEQWRIEQLTLVRQVSAQIANVLELDELCSRVTRLIQSTFKYYYVAIFTRESGQETLRFRSSAGPAKINDRRKKSPVLQVKIGDGLIGYVAANGEEVVSNDIRTEPRFRFVNSLPETQSEVTLPLKVEDNVLGVLDVQSDQLNAFHPNDLLVLRALADNIATAVENARLFGDLEKRAQQLSVVAEVGRNITTILDLGELLNKVASLIQERFGFPYVQLFSVHPNRRQVIYEAGSGARSQETEGYRLNMDSQEGIIPHVARTGQTILARDVSQEPLYKPSPLPPHDTQAELCVPLIYDTRVVGVLDIQSDKLNAFNTDDRFLFESLADTIAAAIHNADVYRSERWRRQVSDSLREVAGLLSSDVSVDDVLDAILRELERNLPCDVAAVWLMDGEEIYLAHLHGADPVEVEGVARRWPETYAYLVNALDSREPVIRMPVDPLGPTGLACGYAADYSSIAAALRIEDQPVGLLTLSHHLPGRYGHEAQAMTATFASYAAVAIENARLYDSAQEQAYASAALLQVAQAVADSNNLDETLNSIVRITPILVGVKSCAIYFADSESFRPAQAYGFPEDVQELLWGRNFAPGDFPLLDTVRERGQLVIGLLAPSSPQDWLDPLLMLTEEDAYYAMQGGERLLIGFPVMVRNDLFGVMVVEESNEDRRFRQKRIEIISGICQQVALSIQNEHLQREMVLRERLEHEVELARQIQKTFLPDHLPEFPNWDLGAYWRPAREVGGDFYDIFELPDGRLGLFIADVSDKGIPAALFMALTRTLVRAVVYDTPSPAAVLQRVNNIIIPDNEQSMFVTAFYASLDLNTGMFEYANAGHNPPLWFTKKNGSITALPRTGMALGIVENTEMENKIIQLHGGDFVLMYTDGLTEAFSPEEEAFGEERVNELLHKHADDTAASMMSAFENAINGFSGMLPPADDLTMVSIRCLL